MSEENLDISVDELLKEINVIDPRIIALALERMRSRHNTRAPSPMPRAPRIRLIRR